MKLYIVAFIMQAVVGLGIVATRSSASSSSRDDAPASSTRSADDGSSDAIPRIPCLGQPPCCEFADDGSGRCTIHAVCFDHIWTCP